MNELIIPRPNNATDMRLYSVERVMPLIKRYTRLSPDIAEVIESVGECQEEIGHRYGCEYLALLPVERDGNAYLPLHARKVVSVYPAPWSNTQAIGYDYASSWEPGSGYNSPWPGRQWVADQIGDMQCWRLSQLEAIAWRSDLQPVPFQRTAQGIFLQHYRRPYSESGVVHHVLVVYDAELTDSRGYPLVNDRDARACAYFWNWQRLSADRFAGIKHEPETLQEAFSLMCQYVDQARIGDGLTDEDWRLIQRTSASWDRTTFREGLAGPGRYPGAGGSGHRFLADGGW